MIVLDPGAIGQVVREPREVQKEKQAAAEAANRARLEEQRQKNEEKKRMKVGGCALPLGRGLHLLAACCARAHTGSARPETAGSRLALNPALLQPCACCVQEGGKAAPAGVHTPAAG